MTHNIGRLRIVSRKFITASLAVLFVVSISAPSFAVVAADSTDCTPVVAAPTGIQSPTGADAPTYVYNPCTGLWENQYYTWSPATKKTTPIIPLVYTYNTKTSKWDSQKWVYSPASKSWYQQKVAVATPPAGAPTIGGPTLVAADTSTNDGGSGPGPSGAVGVTNANTTGINDSTNSGVNNTIGSTATSGNASVVNNTQGGSATTGNAQAIANVINALQSSTSLGSASTTTFVANIDGDVQGDLLIDPSTIQPTTDSTVNNSNNLTLNVDNNGQITNNLTLNAQSGNATVAGNTNAGDATTGTAQAVADVMNMINSMISASQSFLGVININGNLNGNILMPQSFLDSLIASNAPHSDVQVSQSTLNSLAVNISNNDSIANNVTNSATTGNASVKGNTNGGSATSGNANTNVTIFDLTGLQLTGGNTMLVFVNVLGSWVGVLMDAPAGSTAAAYGGGVTSITNTNTADITANSTAGITNNIDVNAASGNAKVANNTNAGNASSGNADTAVNLNNIIGSNFSLTGWFGILFINVFGNWNGNFGVMPPSVTNSSAAPTSSGTGGTIPQVFKFVPKTTTTSTDGSSAGGSHIDATLASVVAKVKAAKTTATTPQAMNQAVQQSKNQAIFIGGAMLAAGLVLLAIEQLRAFRHKSNTPVA